MLTVTRSNEISTEVSATRKMMQQWAVAIGNKNQPKVTVRDVLMNINDIKPEDEQVDLTQFDGILDHEISAMHYQGHRTTSDEEVTSYEVTFTCDEVGKGFGFEAFHKRIMESQSK